MTEGSDEADLGRARGAVPAADRDAARGRGRCTISDFLGAELYERAAATAGGEWAALLMERAAEEGGNDA